MLSNTQIERKAQQKNKAQQKPWREMHAKRRSTTHAATSTFQDAEMEATTIRYTEGNGLAFTSEQSCFRHSVNQ